MSKVSSSTFLQQLQEQAKLQSHLSTSRVLPKQLDPLSTFIGNCPWQIILVLSGVTAFLATWKIW